MLYAKTWYYKFTDKQAEQFALNQKLRTYPHKRAEQIRMATIKSVFVSSNLSAVWNIWP